MDKAVDIRRVEMLGQEFGIKVFETSSKENSNVAEIFEYLTGEIFEKYQVKRSGIKPVIEIRPSDSDINSCC
jgi:hypothetical protein